jgi:transposase InsO family protein
MARINVDTIGPLEPDEKGNKFILAIIDNFSRYLTLHPIPDTKVKDAARALLRHIAMFGSPNQVTSDQGSQFVNYMVEELLILLGSSHNITSISYSHEENSIVERSNKETMRHLRSILFERTLAARWSEALPLVQRLHNSKIHGSTGVTPTKILFGTSIDLDTNLFLPDEHRDSEGTPVELSTYMRDLLDVQDKVLQLARANIRAQDERNVAERTAKVNKVTEYPDDDGSWVMMMMIMTIIYHRLCCQQ